MPYHPLTDEQLNETIEVYRGTGGNVSETSRILDLERMTIRHRLKVASERGLIDEIKFEPNHKRHMAFEEVRQKQREQFRRRKENGDWREPHKVTMPDDQPFLIIAIGDPHLDNPGTDLDLFEKWIEPLNRGAGVYGFALGDWTDNWVGFLKMLYKDSENTEHDALVLLDHYLEQTAPDLIGSVSGNHDEWSAYLNRRMEHLEVLHRQHGILMEIVTPSREYPITLCARHRWKGHSSWNPAHGALKGATIYRDHIILGGDYHVSGEGIHKDAKTGQFSHYYQVASFKLFDDYVDAKQFTDHHASPAVAVLVDPSKPATDPSMVKSFYDIEDALTVLDALRSDRHEKSQKSSGKVSA